MLSFVNELKMSGKGKNCPCCGRYAQIYYRGISKTVAKQLATLWALQETPESYVRASKLVLGSSGVGDLTKAKYFGLIEERPHTPDAKKTSGLWRLTAKGVDFIRGRIAIPRRVAIYNDEVLGYSDKTMMFHEALGEPFNYKAMMEQTDAQ